MTRAFLPAMLNRGSGRCFFVVASRLVWPGAAGYTAARWALRGLFEAIRAETAGTGVGATMVTFAKVRRNYWANNPGSEDRIPKAQAAIPVLSVEQAAQAILKGLETDKEEIIEPLALRFVLKWNHWFPMASRKLMLQPTCPSPEKSARGTANAPELARTITTSSCPLASIHVVPGPIPVWAVFAGFLYRTEPLGVCPTWKILADIPKLRWLSQPRYETTSEWFRDRPFIP